MIRKIIKIDESKCNGCGLCAAACHEGAIGMVDGVAKLLREDYCDGLGDCLPACPTGAITFEEREAPAYDEAAVKAAQAAKSVQPDIDSIIRETLAGGCPGSQSKSLRREPDSAATEPAVQPSQLSNWPVQIKLAPVNAPYFNGANLRHSICHNINGTITIRQYLSHCILDRIGLSIQIKGETKHHRR